MTDHTTIVHLFAGHAVLDDGRTPDLSGQAEWTGTLGEFWHDNEGAYNTFEQFQTELTEPGFMYLGGIGEPDFTLVTDEVFNRSARVDVTLTRDQMALLLMLAEYAVEYAGTDMDIAKAAEAEGIINAIKHSIEVA